MQGDDAPERIAAMISTVAEVVPEEAGTYANRAIEGVRMIDKKKGKPWYKKAGIDMTVQPDVAMAVMSKYWDQHPEIQLPGETIDDFLRSRVGLEFRRSKGMGAIISGMKSGVFENRIAAGQKITPDNVVSNLDKDMQGNVTMEHQRAVQQLAEAENQQGDPKQRLEGLRDKMRSILVYGKNFNEPGKDPRWQGVEGVNKWLFNHLFAPMMGTFDDNADIEVELIKLLSDRGERMGTTKNDLGTLNYGNPTWRRNTIAKLAPMAELRTGQTVEQLLDAILNAIKEQKEQHAAGVPNNAQVGGMVKP